MKKVLSEDQKRKRAESAKAWRKANPERVREHSRRTREKNKEKIRERQKAWVQANTEKRRIAASKYYEANKVSMREKQLMKSFGITLEQYNAMFIAQGGLCAICSGGPDASGKGFAVDHCHKTGKVRALLCRGCNVGIGNLKDDPELLIKAAEYITRNRES